MGHTKADRLLLLGDINHQQPELSKSSPRWQTFFLHCTVGTTALLFSSKESLSLLIDIYVLEFNICCAYTAGYLQVVSLWVVKFTTEVLSRPRSSFVALEQALSSRCLTNKRAKEAPTYSAPVNTCTYKYLRPVDFLRTCPMISQTIFFHVSNSSFQGLAKMRD